MKDLPLHVFEVAADFCQKFYDGVVTLNLSIILGTVIALFLSLMECTIPDSNVVKAELLRFVRSLPIMNRIIQRKIENAVVDIHKTVHGHSHIAYEKHLPSSGIPVDGVLRKVKKYKAMEYVKWKEGFTSGCVYAYRDSLSDLSTKIFHDFLLSNPLHPDVFPDVRRMEAEVVRMCLTMFNGDHESCGTMTSGGTESIILACLAYREVAKRKKKIRQPVMVIPETAHPAFDKAAYYFSVDVVRVPVHPDTYKVDVRAMQLAITRNTCMLVASVPGFPHGIIDPVEEIALLGLKYNIPVHVDCCLGGFLLPFMDSAGYPVEPFDFRLPGVTSISCDTHKYGFSAKGTSVILFRNRQYRSMQFFTQPNWPGGVYASPTIAGSRPGSLIAVTWATMLHIGEDGYVQSTRRIVRTTRFIAHELRKIPGISVLGEPKVSIVAFTSDLFSIYQLGQQLSNLANGRGWILNSLQSPQALHLCVTDLHTSEGRAEAFIRDVSQAASELRNKPKNYADGAAALYGLSTTIPDRSIISEFAVAFLDACYDTPSVADHDGSMQEMN